MWLRSGDSSTVNNFLNFLEDTLAKCGDKKWNLFAKIAACFNKIFILISKKKIKTIS
jgi:hypothetical protein